MPELNEKVMRTIKALDGKTIGRYKKVIDLLGPANVASIESMARNPEVSYTEFSEWLGDIQTNCEMIANNCRRIQEEL
jgi:hypothetical protein